MSILPNNIKYCIFCGKKLSDYTEFLDCHKCGAAFDASAIESEDNYDIDGEWAISINQITVSPTGNIYIEYNLIKEEASLEEVITFVRDYFELEIFE
jgi:hypothetical protein